MARRNRDVEETPPSLMGASISLSATLRGILDILQAQTDALGITATLSKSTQSHIVASVGAPIQTTSKLKKLWTSAQTFTTIKDAATPQHVYGAVVVLPPPKGWLHVTIRTVTPLDEKDQRIVQLYATKIASLCSHALTSPEPYTDDRSWKQIVDSYPEPLLIVDREATILYANQAAADVFQAEKPSSLVGQSELDFITHDFQDQFVSRVAALQANEATAPLAYPIVLPRGEERIVESFSIPILFQGQPAAQSVVRDITLRTRAERAVRESEERWRKLVEQHPNPIFISIAGTIVFVNPAGLQLLGASSERQVVGQRTQAILTAKYEPLLQVAPHKLRDKPEEFEIETLDGRMRCIEIYAGKIRYGGAEAVQLVLRDVTERNRYEHYLKRYTERLRMLNELQRHILAAQSFSDVAEQALTLLHKIKPYHCGTVLEYNFEQQQAHLCGTFGPPLAQHGPSHTSIPNHTIDLSVLDYIDVLRSGQQYRVHRLEANPQHELLAQLYALGIRSFVVTPMLYQGELLGALNIGVATMAAFSDDDVDIFREVADVLAIGLKQSQLHQAQHSHKVALIAAKEKAEEMNRLKSTFLANMSHEIRTPLTSIIGFADVLAEEEVSEENKEFARLIRLSGQRLLETLNSVLDLAQLEGRTLSLYPEQLDVEEEIDSLIDIFSQRAADKGLELHQTGLRIPVFANLDRGAFSRVLTNLIGNALKFTEEGGVMIDLAADPEHLYVHVKDTGVGISPSFLPDIFSEFRQESSGVSRYFEGSGLGLAITKRLVELMNGSISVVSTKGLGSTFTLTFPRIHPSDVCLDHTPSYLSGTITGPKPCVLVVEDNEDTLQLITHFIQANYTLLLAQTAEEAYQLATQHTIDAFLIDINLGAPKTGVDVLQELRTLPTYTQTPMLACTAYALPSNREQLLEAGFDGYISKPFTRSTLLTTLHEALANAASQGGIKHQEE